MQLWQRLNTAITSASSALVPGEAAKSLKPIVTATEMVFASAAALSATFGLKASHPLQSIGPRSSLRDGP